MTIGKERKKEIGQEKENMSKRGKIKTIDVMPDKTGFATQNKSHSVNLPKYSTMAPVPPLTVRMPATLRMMSLGAVQPDSWPVSLTPIILGAFSSQGRLAMTSTASAMIPSAMLRPSNLCSGASTYRHRHQWQPSRDHRHWECASLSQESAQILKSPSIWGSTNQCRSGDRQGKHSSRG